MSQADHIMHRGARRVHRDGQMMRGLGATMALCGIERTEAHCHHGHVVQVAALPLPIVLDWQAPYQYQFMGVRVSGRLPLALTVKP